MSRFFVGQRVRIICVEKADNASLLGREARIVEVSHSWPWVGPVYGLDLYPITHVDGITLVWGAHQLEPILPSGHCASDFTYQELMDKCREGQGVAA